MSVRIVNQARPVPITAVDADTTNPSSRERRSGSQVDCDNNSEPRSVPKSRLRLTT